MAKDRESDSPEESEERGFKITDRRHWAREEAQEPSPAEPEAPSTPPEPEAPSEVEAPPQPEATPEAEAPPEEELPPPDFHYLVVFLGTQALLCMGEQPDAAAGEKFEKNLPGAKHAIDLLGVIQDKTKGNLDDDESQLLESLLYDLRMRYVQATGPGAS
ncbi:MAG: DUF1844 domain-containing protein [Nitrospinae bacterium]|nr:DUF1844 domain-containing protein [Nitrospinota bacterium]